jgi:hypothetical protein
LEVPAISDVDVATLCIKQYRVYRLFAVNDSGESITNYNYLIEIETVFEKPAVRSLVGASS